MTFPRICRLYSLSRSKPSRVLPGLVPGIHAERKLPTSKVSCNGAAWMAGTSPAKTRVKGLLMNRTAVAQGRARRPDVIYTWIAPSLGSNEDTP
jgi:hypothetical protein